MFKKNIAVMLLTILNFSVFATEMCEPNQTQILDLGKTYTSFTPNDFWRFGNYAFNSAPELTPYFAMLKKITILKRL